MNPLDRQAAPGNGFDMKETFIFRIGGVLLLALFAAGCLHEFPTSSATEQQACNTVTNAIDRGDWKFLRATAGKASKANRYLDLWERHPIRIGKPKGDPYETELDGRRCTIYSFAFEYPDGRTSPHWVEIVVGRQDGGFAVLDFWESGW